MFHRAARERINDDSFHFDDLGNISMLTKGSRRLRR